jgi:branched-subunit amino acid aminotransferase/4-amino-4-deoxychorismate lyase
MRLFPGGFLPFLDEHLERLLSSAQKLSLPWIPEQAQLLDHLNEVLGMIPNEDDCLVRLCLFEDLLGIATRPAESDGNPVEGWLLPHRRPEPSLKCTADQKLYGSLHELDLKSEDWMIIDPKDNDLRETATSNLIFAEGNNLLIPDDRILNGIVLQKIKPLLGREFSVTTGRPQDQDLSTFSEILLCGTGRGVAPLTSLSELGWSSQSDETFTKIRALYDQLIESARG